MSRVLLLGSYAPSLVLFRAPLLKALVQAGHEVVASAPDEDSSIAGAMDRLGVRWAPIDFDRNKVQPLKDLRLVRRLRSHLRDIQPDRLITYTIKPNIYGGWAASSEDIPSAAMITGLGTMFMNSGVRKRIAERMLRKAVRHHDRVFFQNGDDRDDLVNAGVVEDASKIVMTAGSGVDLETYPVQPLPEAPVFLMLARLLVAKGVREYIEAASILKRRCPDAVVRLGGMEDPGSGGVPMSGDPAGCSSVLASIEYHRSPQGCARGVGPTAASTCFLPGMRARPAACWKPWPRAGRSSPRIPGGAARRWRTKCQRSCWSRSAGPRRSLADGDELAGGGPPSGEP